MQIFKLTAFYMTCLLFVSKPLNTAVRLSRKISFSLEDLEHPVVKLLLSCSEQAGAAVLGILEQPGTTPNIAAFELNSFFPGQIKVWNNRTPGQLYNIERDSLQKGLEDQWRVLSSTIST